MSERAGEKEREGSHFLPSFLHLHFFFVHSRAHEHKVVVSMYTNMQVINKDVLSATNKNANNKHNSLPRIYNALVRKASLVAKPYLPAYFSFIPASPSPVTCYLCYLFFISEEI